MFLGGSDFSGGGAMASLAMGITANRAWTTGRCPIPTFTRFLLTRLNETGFRWGRDRNWRIPWKCIYLERGERCFNRCYSESSEAR